MNGEWGNLQPYDEGLYAFRENENTPARWLLVEEQGSPTQAEVYIGFSFHTLDGIEVSQLSGQWQGPFPLPT